MADCPACVPLRVWPWALVAAAAILPELVLRPEPQEVELGTADRGDVATRVWDRGFAQAQEVCAVSARVGGRLQRMEVEAGDPGRGRPCADRPPAARRSRLSRHPARGGGARLNRGSRGPRRSGCRDRARAGAGALAARLEHDLVAARARDGWVAGPLDARARSKVEIRSPASGRVLELHRQSETVVGPGAPIVSAGDPAAALEIVGAFLSTDAARLQAGAPALIEQCGGPEPRSGPVRPVEPVGFLKVSTLGIGEQRVRVRIEILDPRERRPALGQGYRVEARVESGGTRRVVRVPHPRRWSKSMAAGRPSPPGPTARICARSGSAG